MHRSSRLCRARSFRSGTFASVLVVNDDMAATKETMRLEERNTYSPAALQLLFLRHTDIIQCIYCAQRCAKSAVILGAPLDSEPFLGLTSRL